jgi:methanogenic corrinoid protein MtbC1
MDEARGLNDTTRALRARLDDLLFARDRTGFVTTVLDAVRNRTIAIPRLYALVLGPLLAEEGFRWQSGGLAVWQEHEASAIVRTAIEALYPLVAKRATEATPTERAVLLACPPQEQHDIGIRMLADRFALAGWTAHFLGADTPIPEIVAATKATGAKLIVLSAATHFHRLHVREYLVQLQTGLPGVEVLLTGPAYVSEADAALGEALLDAEALLGDLCEDD